MSPTKTNTSSKIRIPAIVLAVCLLLMIVSSGVGAAIVGNGGHVKTQNITFTTDIGVESHAKMYIPDTATAQTPAPAVILCHGYTASSDAMEPNAIELSRRGYVVMALDMYGHGDTPLPETGSGYSQAAMGGVVDYAPDLGSYSALQELRNYDFVDLNRVGMLGHSMGTAAIQEGAYIAHLNWYNAYTAALAEAVEAGQDTATDAVVTAFLAANEQYVRPLSLVCTGYNYNTRNGDAGTEDAPNPNYLTYNGVKPENGIFPLALFAVNCCSIEGYYDEFCELLWGVKDARDYTQSFKFAAANGGVSNVESGTYFLYNSNVGGVTDGSPIDRETAAAAGSAAFSTLVPIRAAYGFAGTHSDTYYDETAIAQGIDFLDITLKAGVTDLAPTDQVWHGRAACGLIGLVATLAAFVALAVLLLQVPFFATIKREESRSITTVDSPKHTLRYAIIYVLCLLPAPLLYYWLIGYPYYMQPQWFKFLTKFWPNKFYNMIPMNSLMLFNGVVGLILLAVYLLVFFLIAKKAGCGLEETGLKLPVVQVFKALLLAVVSFLGVYAVVYLCHAFSGTYFSFFKFELMPMDAEHWAAFVKYLPVWLGFFLIVNVIYNSFTRINGAPEWLNILLIAVASCGGLAVMFAIDYGTLFATGYRAFPYVPGTEAIGTSTIGIPFPTSLAGIMCFGLLFILPLSAVASRVLHKKSGSAWLGAFLTAFVVLAFGISHMVVNM